MTDWFDDPGTLDRVSVRAAVPGDALCLGMLATQVFLDTYATEGIPADLAREVEKLHSPAAYGASLSDPARSIHLAEVDGALVGFVEIVLGKPCPLGPPTATSEVLHLYVQRPLLRQGLGSRLLDHAEGVVASHGHRVLWLSSWVGNAPALSFYRSRGYADVGAVDHVIEGQAYENRVFTKSIP